MNLILTKNKKLLLENKLFQQHQETNNMWKIITNLKKCLTTFSSKQQKLFVIGGANVFQQAFPFADYLYASILNELYSGDVYFPLKNWFNFQIVSIFWFNDFKTMIYKKEKFFRIQ
jgi:dihydrofolate reductase